MSLLISDATVIDGVAQAPLVGRSIWIEGGRIKAIAKCDDLSAPPGARVIDGRGKFVIPGLMNANVHLLAIYVSRTSRATWIAMRTSSSKLRKLRFATDLQRCSIPGGHADS